MSDYLPVLPDVLVAETILWRLPVSSIMQCRCVCKSWYSLITSPNFISNQLQKTQKKSHFFMFRKCRLDFTGKCTFLFENRSLYFHLPMYHGLILTIGSVNGLVCLSSGTASYLFELIVLNPSIGRFLSILPPVQAAYWSAMGFGFDETSQDYIIFLLRSNTAGFIYSLNSHCWRRITFAPPPAPWLPYANWMPFYPITFFVNGKFYWLVCHLETDFKYIMMFDTKTEEALVRITLPPGSIENGKHATLSLMQIGGLSIALSEHSIFSGETHIWMMKENGSAESSSWTKLITLGKSLPRLLGFRNKDQLLLRCKSGCIASLNINKNNKKKVDPFELHEEDDEELENIMDMDTHLSFNFEVYNYVPSLVLLDQKNNIVKVPTPTHAKLTRTAPTRVTAPTPTRRRRRRRIHMPDELAVLESTTTAARPQRARTSPAWQSDFVLTAPTRAKRTT